MSEADSVINALGLAPHPEGGHFRETWRDDAAPRGHGTAIYYLLKAGEVSRWHCVDAAEMWHYYAGARLILSIAAPNGTSTRHRLGPDIAAGERPQILVPANHWQSAQSAGDWTLVGCTVTPAFEFAGFEMAAPEWEPRKA